MMLPTGMDSSRATPRIRPSPRISLAKLYFSTRLAKPTFSWAERSATFWSKSGICFTTARPAAHAIGLPPNVVPWSPALSWSAIFWRRSTAPSGRPPPIPFAKETRSGFRPYFSKPQKVPSLPTPACTSSTMTRQPNSFCKPLMVSTISFESVITPPSAASDSSMMAQVLLSTSAFKAAQSFQVT